MKKELKRLLSELEKKGYPVKFAKESQTEEKIKTGIFAFDYVLDGGIGKQHRIELWGREGGGKSLLTLKAIATFQKLDKICSLIDAEHSFDPIWARKHGVNVDDLLLISPRNLEEAGDILYELIIKKVDLIVIDSIIGLIPQAELDRDTDEPTMALNAKVNALICKKINSGLSKSNTSLIFVNQLREKVGVMYGSPYTTSGGHALLHLYDTRIEVKSGKFIEDPKLKEHDKKVKIGKEITLRCNKNRKGIPQRISIFDFYYDGKLDNLKSLFMAGIKYGIIERSGSYYKYKDKKEQGAEKFVELVSEKEWKEIEKQIWKSIRK